LNPRARWPSERDLWKLAGASGGLFVYARTVVKYIGNPDIGDPTEQLNDVLQIIDAHPLPNVPREEHPMALLDTLYSQIMSKVPANVANNTRKLLLALVVGWTRNFDRVGRNFIVPCNWFGMTCDEAYTALRHLNSALDLPTPDKAHETQLRLFRKSLIDYLSDYSRSSFSRDIKHESRQLYVQCALRSLEQAPDGFDVGDVDYNVRAGPTVGILSRVPGRGANVPLTCEADEESDWNNVRTRLYMYKWAFGSLVGKISLREKTFCTLFRIRLLTTRFQSLSGRGIPNLHAVGFVSLSSIPLCS
jgi:hypothetical protein